jgi:hypothetical protein
MTLSDEERGDLETLIKVVSISYSREGFPTPVNEAQQDQMKGYLIGFLSGYLYYRRRATKITPTEQQEIKRIINDNISDLRRAIEKANA